jgi:hypothetical protein
MTPVGRSGVEVRLDYRKGDIPIAFAARSSSASLPARGCEGGQGFLKCRRISTLLRTAAWWYLHPTRPKQAFDPDRIIGLDMIVNDAVA